MAWWRTGDEEHADERFERAGLNSLGLYVRAGSWCMRQVRYRPEDEIPAEWFVPDYVVRGWRSQRLAAGLVREGIWGRVEGGYNFAWILPRNTADEVRRERKRERQKWEAKQARARAAQRANSPGESPPTPQGEV